MLVFLPPPMGALVGGGGPGGGGGSLQGVGGRMETYHINVPGSVVGALIGTGGLNIKQAIRESGAFVMVRCLPFITVSLC